LVAAVAVALSIAPGAQARDAIVESFDNTPIVTHFFPAPGLAKGERAPTIMVGHGWGGSGSTSAPAPYANAGYNVLTWDARGFGGSGGEVMIDHPGFEARDAQALIDFIADQPEAKLDGRRDPRVGMDGPSYGGGIQFITAARDRRLDAIAPTIAWNSLTRSVYQAESIKVGWDLALAGLGIPTATLPGVLSPAGIQSGGQSQQFYDAVVSGLATGRFNDSTVAWFDEHGPAHLLERIKAPTLISQGTVDTLFTLEEAHRNFRALKRRGVPVKMVWFCGGHGVCRTEADAPDLISSIQGAARVDERKLAWFRRYLKGKRKAKTGPTFEWIDEEGTYHPSGRYPLRRAGSVSGNGSGTLPLTPGVLPGSGILLFATPSPLALTVPIETPPVGSHVVGAPKLDLTYTATGVNATSGDNKAHVYAQLVDKQRNLVVNNFATPIPIELDGQEHRIELKLERIASLSTADGYELQIVPQTSVYDMQRAAGLLEVAEAGIELPLAAKGR
jgi:ABC-2 type transport system ATP-binding protein